jgi:hypothetical protein
MSRDCRKLFVFKQKNFYQPIKELMQCFYAIIIVVAPLLSYGTSLCEETNDAQAVPISSPKDQTSSPEKTHTHASFDERADVPEQDERVVSQTRTEYSLKECVSNYMLDLYIYYVYYSLRLQHKIDSIIQALKHYLYLFHKAL